MLQQNLFTAQFLFYWAITDFLLYAKAWGVHGSHCYSEYEKPPCNGPLFSDTGNILKNNMFQAKTLFRKTSALKGAFWEYTVQIKVCS